MQDAGLCIRNTKLPKLSQGSENLMDKLDLNTKQNVLSAPDEVTNCYRIAGAGRKFSLEVSGGDFTDKGHLGKVHGGGLI